MRKGQVSSGSNRPYHSFFKKRLQTQSFLDSEMNSTQISELTNKIIKSLKAANNQSDKNRQKMNRAKTRQKTLQNQEAQSRQKLKSKIQDRMRISRTNLQKMKGDRNKVISSRSQFQASQRKKIKDLQKKTLEQSLVRSTKYQAETQKFFRDSRIKKINEFKRQQQIAKDRNYDSFYPANSTNDIQGSRSRSVTSQYGQNSKTSLNKKQKNVLKVSDNQIKKKQIKKVQNQKFRESKYLGQYIHKMQQIVNIRKKNTKKNEPPKQTLPKVINRERQPISRYRQTKKKQNINASYQKQKKSFNQQYQSKLSEKLAKKQYYHSVILDKGDQILLKQHERTKKNKQQKIIRDALNDYKRWSNFMHHN